MRCCPIVEIKRLWLVLLLLATSAGYGWTATRVVPIDVNLPKRPLISPLPITIGVYYSPEFSTHESIEEVAVGKDSNNYKFNIGFKNVALFDQTFSSMFENVVIVKQMPPLGQVGRQLAAIIVPSMEGIEILDVRDTHKDPHSLVLITYSITLYSIAGTRLASYEVEGAGDSRPTASIGAKSFGEATHFAMRDAAAQIIAGFKQQPGVREWLEDIGLVSSVLLPKRSEQ